MKPIKLSKIGFSLNARIIIKRTVQCRFAKNRAWVLIYLLITEKLREKKVMSQTSMCMWTDVCEMGCYCRVG